MKFSNAQMPLANGWTFSISHEPRMRRFTVAAFPTADDARDPPLRALERRWHGWGGEPNRFEMLVFGGIIDLLPLMIEAASLPPPSSAP